MSDIRVVYGEATYHFAPGKPVSVGRSADCDVVVSDPSVSREHVRITYDEDGWLVSAVGRTPTYYNGQAVSQLRITQPLALHLASPQGPQLHLEPVGARDVGQPHPAVMPDVATPMRHDGHAPVHLSAGVHEFMSAVQILVPLKSWVTNRGWRAGWRLMVIPYALLPLVFLQLYSNTTNPATPGWPTACTSRRCGRWPSTS